MDLSTYLFVTVLKIGRRVPELTRDVVFKEFDSFYNVDVERPELEAAFADLQRQDLIALSGDTIDLTEHGRSVAFETSMRFGFDQGYAMEERSAVDQTYRERLRSKHGVIGLTDPTQREFALRALRESAGPVLDAGCGRGELTELFRRHTGHTVMGFDSSPTILDYARREYPHIDFRQHDLKDIVDYEGEFASAVLVDSLYFVEDQEAVLGALMERIRTSREKRGASRASAAAPEGEADVEGSPGAGAGRGTRSSDTPAAPAHRLVIFYGTFCRPEDDHSVLAAENTPVAAFARSAGCHLQVEDFTDAHSRIWQAKRAELEALKDEYYRQRWAYLFWERFNEIEPISDLVEQGLHGRYVFVLEPS